MEVITDFPERLVKGTRVYVGPSHALLTINQTREHAEGLLIQFVGIDTPEAAAALRKQLVFVRASDRPGLPEGMYYHHELLGFEVVTEDGKVIGSLREIVQTGANDVYVIADSGGGEVLVPAIASVVINIDRKGRQIRIREMPGLLDAQQDHMRGKRH